MSDLVRSCSARDRCHQMSHGRKQWSRRSGRNGSRHRRCWRDAAGCLSEPVVRSAGSPCPERCHGRLRFRRHAQARRRLHSDHARRYRVRSCPLLQDDRRQSPRHGRVRLRHLRLHDPVRRNDDRRRHLRRRGLCHCAQPAGAMVDLSGVGLYDAITATPAPIRALRFDGRAISRGTSPRKRF